MPTSQGSFALTDAGLNVSTQFGDKFRVGAQAYVRKIGEMGKGHVTLDWLSGDYRFNDRIGIRAGKVKTVMGLYNDTQDAEFLQTWALLPQSVYPLDLRDTTLAHVGGDLYGSIPLANFGRLGYTAYAGKVVTEPSAGYGFALGALGIKIQNTKGLVRGADLRFISPIPGLLFGTSFFDTPVNVKGIQQTFNVPARVNVFADARTIFYGQYSRGNFRLDGEYSRELAKVNLLGLFGPFGPPLITSNNDERAWYLAAAYRLSQHLELGTYSSRFFPHADSKNVGGLLVPPGARHIFDQVFTARIDLTRFWDVKVEGHFIDGYADPNTFHGFYPQDNPMGLKQKTNLLVVRMGASF